MKSPSIINIIVNNKKTLVITLFVFIIYSVLSIAVYMTVYDIIKLKNMQVLNEKVLMVKDILSIFNETSKKGCDKIAEVFIAMFKGRISIDESHTINLNGINTPLLRLNNIPLNLNNAYPDKLTEITGGSVATIFVKKGDDFIRIATSLRKEDGSIAIGTNLGKSHPGYKSLMKGDIFSGKANLFGKDYMTKYIPIKSEKAEVIGILFVGYDISDALKSMVNYILSIKITGNGFFFIIDENNEKTQNTLLVHLSEKEHNTRDILKEIVQNKEGIINIKDGGLIPVKSNNKTLIYYYYKDWNWIIGIGIDTNVILKEILIIKNIMLVAGLLSALVISAMFFIAIYEHR